MIEDIDAEIAKLSVEVEKARSALEAARSILERAKRNLHTARDRKHGLRMGRTIVLSKGVEYLVSGSRYFSSDQPTLDGRKRLKSGGWHKTPTGLWGKWEIVGELPDDQNAP